MTILLFTVLVIAILILVCSTEKTIQFQDIILRAVNGAPMRSRLLMLVAVGGCLGFWWFTSGR